MDQSDGPLYLTMDRCIGQSPKPKKLPRLLPHLSSLMREVTRPNLMVTTLLRIMQGRENDDAKESGDDDTNAEESGDKESTVEEPNE
ncbi:hypothetical protein HAX54_042050 [Datura stramonium]|uniref:Uncharacterized protein n=1 Tax=Datura stramonium TaxID=4076 RepID=A0ABS8W3G6_DATST|nr:hypothetical protein [Datura stramonium]